MARSILFLFTFAVLSFGVVSQEARADDDELSTEVTDGEAFAAEERAITEEPSLGRQILFYLPNRVFDLIDIFRARVRVGPGVGVDVHATRYASVFLGSYASIYAGLPGPRLRRMPRSPIGLENRLGASVSTLDATANVGFGPNYSETEIGTGVHLGVVGADVGFDPVEIVDFFTGFFLVDVREDDF